MLENRPERGLFFSLADDERGRKDLLQGSPVQSAGRGRSDEGRYSEEQDNAKAHVIRVAEASRSIPGLDCFVARGAPLRAAILDIPDHALRAPSGLQVIVFLGNRARRRVVSID
jgi:hypothetical protein